MWQVWETNDKYDYQVGLRSPLGQRRTGSNMSMLQTTVQYQIGTGGARKRQDYSKHLTCDLSLALSVLLINCAPGFLISYLEQGKGPMFFSIGRNASSGATRPLALREPVGPRACVFFYMHACFFYPRLLHMHTYTHPLSPPHTHTHKHTYTHNHLFFCKREGGEGRGPVLFSIGKLASSGADKQLQQHKKS